MAFGTQTTQEDGATYVETSVLAESDQRRPLEARAALIVEVNFGLTDSDIARTTVNCGKWLTEDSRLVASFAGETDDHDVEDALIEQLHVVCGNIVPGVGFDVIAHAPEGTTGSYAVHVLGV